MGAQPKVVTKRMGAEDYVAWAMEQPLGRFELLAGEVVAQASERAIHARVKARTFAALERAIAARAGMRPAVAVAGLLDDALARGEQGALVGDWLRLLRDAVDCDRTDPAAARAFAAACAVRFVG